MRGQVPERPRTVGAPQQWRLPKISSMRLENGMRVLLAEEHSAPVVAVRLELGIDSLLDPRGKEGLADVTSLLLADATTSRNSAELADAQAMIGTRVTASGFTTTKEEFAPALRLLADIVENSEISPGALERAKALMSRRIAAAKRIDTPRHLFLSRVYGADSPFLRRASDSSVSRLSVSDVVAFRNQFMHPERATLVVVGDIDASSARAAISTAFQAWRRGAAAPQAGESSSTVSHVDATKIYLVDAPGATDVITYIGGAGPPITARDRAALDAVSLILGVGPGSRVLRELSTRRGFIYSGSGLLTTWRPAPLPSTLWGSALVNPTKIDTTLDYWIASWRAIGADKPISEAETNVARLRLVVNAQLALETPDGFASQLVSSIKNREPIDDAKRYIEAAKTLTSADLNRAARQYLHADHLVVVVAGDRKTIEPLLRAANIAPVVVVDESGKPISDR